MSYSRRSARVFKADSNGQSLDKFSATVETKLVPFLKFNLTGAQEELLIPIGEIANVETVTTTTTKTTFNVFKNKSFAKYEIRDPA